MTAPVRSTCRLCGEPITAMGRSGFYHDSHDLGTVRGIPPHFASPVRAVA